MLLGFSQPTSTFSSSASIQSMAVAEITSLRLISSGDGLGPANAKLIVLMEHLSGLPSRIRRTRPADGARPLQIPGAPEVLEEDWVVIREA